MKSRREFLGAAAALAALVAIPTGTEARQGPRLRYQRNARIRCGRFGCRRRWRHGDAGRLETAAN